MEHVRTTDSDTVGLDVSLYGLFRALPNCATQHFRVLELATAPHVRGVGIGIDLKSKARAVERIFKVLDSPSHSPLRELVHLEVFLDGRFAWLASGLGSKKDEEQGALCLRSPVPHPSPTLQNH